MTWFTAWWEQLGMLGQTLACVAIPGTILLIVQTILLVVGGAFGHDSDSADFDHGGDFGHDGVELDDGDHDFSHDSDFDYTDSSSHDMANSGDGLRVFTIRGMVAFSAVGGWTGLALWDGTRNAVITLLGAAFAGSVALVFAALVIKWSLKLQEAGNINPRNAIAQIGTVYIPIQPKRSHVGQVTIMLQGRFIELDAVTDNDASLKTGQTVQVVGIQGASTLVVSPVVR
ncbi:MAG: NfeD family protein [Oscillospiraceae bacterium]|jgi:hypothetical protein|nr:NfeD family protein [Oscillospiraceae bacterium]